MSVRSCLTLIGIPIRIDLDSKEKINAVPSPDEWISVLQSQNPVINMVSSSNLFLGAQDLNLAQGADLTSDDTVDITFCPSIGDSLWPHPLILS